MRLLQSLVVLIAAVLLQILAAPAFAQAQIRISPDGRSFVWPDGRPFFWLGDTAWELFHRTTLPEAELYLENRRRKGFTVIQAVILAELGGLRVPNSNGDLPLIGNDPLKPNEAYFRHIDAIVALAERKGLVMALLPTWGDKFNKKWGEGPEVFTPENARGYGAYLGKRYRRKDVVWLLGGDRNPETDRHKAIIRAMADGLRAGDARQPITYHPQGFTASFDFFAKEPWIDFHMFQSGHDQRDLDNQRWTLKGRDLTPGKPVLDGEPRYEDHPVALYKLGEKWVDQPDSWFDAFDVRQAAWWSMLSGAAGHTYGNHNIWQMWQPGRSPVSRARTPWKVALDHPGAAQMGLMRRFLEAHGFGQLEPAQELLAANSEGAGHQRAARSRNERFVIVYSPLGEMVRLARQVLVPGTRASWFDPRTSALRVARFGSAGFDPPGAPARGNDWVLLIERANR